ncbi:MAG: hypothetical protein JWP97_2872 [Labilithrix sp.]|nr:hypothetical protein [Labilithrix sp.]
MPVPPSSARPTLRRALPSSRALVLFGVQEPARSQCEALAIELGLGFAEARNLLSACRALARHPNAMVIGSTGLRSWDREVFEVQAAQAKMPVHWLDEQEDAQSVELEVRRWARMSTRPLAELG